VQGWLKIKQACMYCGISERTFRNWLKDGMRFSKLPSGTVLIKKEWIDEFITGHEVTGNKIDDLISSLKF
jgi:excisionase family DNA binding protein